MLVILNSNELVKKRVSDLIESTRGERECIKGRSGLLLEYLCSTITREAGKAEVVEDETQKFGRKKGDHREGGVTTIELY